MTDLPQFVHRKADFSRLLAYGFGFDGKEYRYRTLLLDGAFALDVTVSDTGAVEAKVFDTLSGDEYALVHVPSAQGAFVGAVREAYEAELTEIAENCFIRSVFIEPQSIQLIEYIRTVYGCNPEYLWEKFPENAVFRCPDNGKWFAAILTAPYSAIGSKQKGKIEVLNLKMPIEGAQTVVDGNLYFPGYHMNKKHWLSVPLDSRVPSEEIIAHIARSYALVRN